LRKALFMPLICFASVNIGVVILIRIKNRIFL